MNKFLHRLLFTLILLGLPFNLGLHFLSTDAYVSARLVDYLVPTIWIQDILIFLLFIFWLIDCGLKKLVGNSTLRFLFLFVISLLPSLVLADNFAAAFSFWCHLFLYTFFCYYTFEFAGGVGNFRKILKILSLGVLILFVFSIGQWLKQGSLFDNYLFLGEQPYDSSTFGIARTDFFGALKIPVYGTFRHPNIFGGYLAIILFWLYAFVVVIENKIWLKVIFALGFISLFLSFSLTSMIALFLGIIFLQIIQKYGKRGVLFSMFFTFSVFVSGLLLPYLSSTSYFENDPSFYRRSNLLKSSYEMLEDSSLFGVGLNNFTIHLKDYVPRTQILTFNQPVHNIFVLIVTESGIFSLLLYLSVLFLAIKSTLAQKFGVAAIFFISILQIVIMGSFDHFFYTIHQTSILFWLTVGLALTYTKEDVEV